MSKLAELASGSPIEVEAEGGSMFPLIRNGQTVLVRPIDRPLRRGDVVLVAIDSRWIIHRIVHVDDQRVTTRGDNQPHGDRPTSLAAVQGIAVRVVETNVRLEWSAPMLKLWLGADPIRRRIVRFAAAVLR